MLAIPVSEARLCRFQGNRRLVVTLSSGMSLGIVFRSTGSGILIGLGSREDNANLQWSYMIYAFISLGYVQCIPSTRYINRWCNVGLEVFYCAVLSCSVLSKGSGTCEFSCPVPQIGPISGRPKCVG